jgi:excisionase family DNA binding protein
MPISQREAAKQWGMSRATIQRHIAAGKLSATRDNNGKHVIDPAEMQRLYGPPKSDSIAPLDTPPVPVASDTVELAVLRAENAALKANLADLRDAMQRLTHEGGPARNRRWWPWGKA